MRHLTVVRLRLLLLDLGVPFIDAPSDPLGKRLTDHRIDHVADIFTRQLLYLSLQLRQGLHGSRILLGELDHVLQLESLEVRDTDVLDLVGVDPSPLAGLKITKVKDRDGLVRR